MEAYMLYTSCRSQQLFTIDIVKGSGKSQSVTKKVLPFPIGITTLPENGGMLDQPYRTMEYFDIFLAEERRVFYKMLKE